MTVDAVAGHGVAVGALSGPAGASVRLTVTDDGPGVDPVDLPFIFDRFYRAQGARGTSGAGLGLAICRGLVEAQGGSIAAADAAGGGARFTVLLPAAGVGLPAGAAELTRRWTSRSGAPASRCCSPATWTGPCSTTRPRPSPASARRSRSSSPPARSSRSSRGGRCGRRAAPPPHSASSRVIFACYHGALVVEAGGAVIRHRPLPPGPARAVAAEVLAQGVAVTVWDVDEPRELEPGTSRGDDQDDEPGDQVSRLVLHGDPATTARLLPELRAEWSGRLRVEPIRPGFLGVFAPEVDKGDALRLVAGRLGVSPERTVACGDGTADETLLAAAAVRIAVGGRPHVLGHLPDVVVTDWARLPETLRAQVLPLL